MELLFTVIWNGIDMETKNSGQKEKFVIDKEQYKPYNHLFTMKDATTIFYYTKSGYLRMFSNTNFTCKGILINDKV